MRFVIGLALGILLGMWLQANGYTLRLPFEKVSISEPAVRL